MKNKINTSDGLVTFVFPDGREVSMNPTRVGWQVNGDTISFFVAALPVNSGHAIMASRFSDLELNGTTYQSIDALEDAVDESFVAAGASLRTEVVTELPDSGTSGTIYLVPKEGEEGYDEYIWIDDEGTFEQIGDASIDLSGYVTDEEFGIKLGSAFTGANSGVTVTEAIENVEVDLTDYYTKSEVYNKTETYTKEEVDAKLEKPSVSGHTIVFPAAGAIVNNHTLRIL